MSRPTYQTRYLQTFADVYDPAERALVEIASGSLTGRQLHALRGILHGLADEITMAKVPK